MIRITKVEFENYRQYRSISVSFAKGKNNDLHILRAKNGTGKTTFLNGILWCLYAEEHYLNDKDKALPIVNNALVQASPINTTLKVVVRITVSNNDEIIVFERTQPFFVIERALSGSKTAKNGESKLKITITPMGSNKNSIVYESEEDVKSYVKQFFDEAIYDYYFFDGENLKNYFSKGKAETIKRSIYNISQVTLLSNAAKHMQSMADERSRKVSRYEKEIREDIISEILRLEETIQRLKKENEEIDRRRPSLEAKFNDADKALRDYAPIRMNIKKRNMLEHQLNALQDEYKEFQDEKNRFIVRYLTLLNFYPRVKYTLELIRDKQDKGTLPPNIDKDQIQQLLADHAQYCPVCNGILDERAITHLQWVLDRLDVSSATSNFLMEIKGSLESIVEECKVFPKKKEEIFKKEKYYSEEIKAEQSQLSEISAFLTKYSDEDGTVDVKSLEAERKSAQDCISSDDRRKALNEADIKRYQECLIQKTAEQGKREEEQAKKNLLSRQVKVFRILCAKYEDIQHTIMNEIKKDIQQQTWKRFDAMIWKRNTFGGLTINDSYELSVVNKNNHEMTGSLSATEYMALAYSFTLAIHDASGKNCPLVVDSPLGRVSDANRENMASELLKVSEEKQIIMLFTPDEYSDEVKNLYDENAASIRDIALSDDENEIKGIGV